MMVLLLYLFDAPRPSVAVFGPFANLRDFWDTYCRHTPLASTNKEIYANEINENVEEVNTAEVEVIEVDASDGFFSIKSSSSR